MNRHSVRLLAAAFAAVGLAGCFDDPTSSLRNGPADLELSHTSVVVANGDSVLVEAVVRDEQGNPLPASGASWTTDNGSVAAVALAGTQPPGEGASRAYIRATNAVGAVTYVRVSIRGLADSVRVASLPAVLNAGAVTVVGTARADTAPGNIFYSAGDTVEIRLPSAALTFDATGSVARAGTNTAYTLFRSDTLLRVLLRGPNSGPLTITRIYYAGALGTGAILIDSLFTTDVVQASRPRLRGTVSVSGDTVSVTATGGTQFVTTGTNVSQVYVGAARGRTIELTPTLIRAIAPEATPSPYTGGITVRRYAWDAANTIDSAASDLDITVARAQFPAASATVSSGILLTVTPPAGMTFEVAATDTNLRATVKFGTVFANRISRTTTEMKFSAPADYNGPITVTNLNYGTFRIDSLKTAGAVAIARPLFPGTISATGNDLLDTLTVDAPAGFAFETGATPSQVVTGGTRAIVISRTAAQMVVISSASGAVTLTNINVGGTVFPSMFLATPVTIGTTTGESGEPANSTPGGVTINLTGTSAAAPLYVVGAVDGRAGVGTDADDFFTFTLAAPATVTMQLQFGGTGAGGAVNPDLDLLACDAACANFVGGFGGATSGNPENLVLTNQAAGTYNIWVNGWDTNLQTRSYRLVVYAQ